MISLNDREMFVPFCRPFRQGKCGYVWPSCLLDCFAAFVHDLWAHLLTTLSPLIPRWSFFIRLSTFAFVSFGQSQDKSTRFKWSTKSVVKLHLLRKSDLVPARRVYLTRPKIRTNFSCLCSPFRIANSKKSTVLSSSWSNSDESFRQFSELD